MQDNVNMGEEKVEITVESCEKKTVETAKPHKVTPKSPKQKKREKEDFKRKYFDFYDDVKTNIKQDW